SLMEGERLVVLGGLVGGHITPAELLGTIFRGLGLETHFTQEIADAILKGDKNALGSVLAGGDAFRIFQILWNAMKNDKAIYWAFLLYGNCANSPVGCPPE